MVGVTFHAVHGLLRKVVELRSQRWMAASKLHARLLLKYTQLVQASVALAVTERFACQSGKAANEVVMATMRHVREAPTHPSSTTEARCSTERKTVTKKLQTRIATNFTEENKGNEERANEERRKLSSEVLLFETPQPGYEL